MKKIAHIIEAGRYGGPNRTISSICQNKNNYEFIVISGDEDSNQFRNELNDLKIRHYFLNLTRIRFKFLLLIKYLINFIKELFIIIKILKSERVDLIHTHTFLDIKGVIAGRILGIPVIWQIHSSVLNQSFKPIFKLVKKIHKGSYICVSNLTKKVFFESDNLSKIEIIQSPVNTKIFNFINEHKSIENKKNIKICSVANFHKGKGHKYLIDLIDYMNKQNNNFVFKLYLKGRVYQNNLDYYNEIINLINQKSLHDFIFIDKNRPVFEFLSNKDIFILNSEAEASPISVWEAASFGIPILCTNVGDVKLFIEKYDSGQIFYNNDLKKSETQIMSFLDKKNYIKYSKNSRKMVLNEICQERIANMYINFYNENLK